MKNKTQFLKDGAFSLLTLMGCFALNLLLQRWFDTKTLVPTIFVLGVFLISWRTQGYFWGIAASMVSVLAVNYAFTFPYYAFDLISPVSLSSAIIMLIVAIITGMLTTRIKRQEQIKAQMARERMRFNLLRAVSHDLRTPLTSIYGATAAVLENFDALSREQHMQLLEDVQEDAQWLVRMVENLLSVTRLDGGSVKLAKTPTVLEELVDATLLSFRKHHPKQAVQVSIPEEFISIPMDAMLIQQVLINLLENAVYHAKGMTKLEFILETQENSLCFRIRDDGCGIPADRLPELFTGYPDRWAAPVDGSRSNMGIGLSVCAAIVAAHGSQIHARNLPRGGAEFYFALEMEDQHEHQPLQDPAD